MTHENAHETVDPDGTVRDALGNAVGIDQPAAAAEIASQQQQGDQRYTTEAIAGYSDQQLVEHLGEREAQLARCRARRENEQLALDIAEPDTPEWADALNNISLLAREHAEQRRHIARLENEIERREHEARADVPAKADATSADLELLEDLWTIAYQGDINPCDENREHLEWLWTSAYLALDTIGSAYPVTRRMVAEQVNSGLARIVFADDDPEATRRRAARDILEAIGTGTGDDVAAIAKELERYGI